MLPQFQHKIVLLRGSLGHDLVPLVWVEGNFEEDD